MKGKRRVCRKSGCPTAHRNTNGYCDRHKGLASWGKSQKERGNRHARGYGYDWDKKRIIILKRDNYLCQHCLVKGIVTAGNNVDHILSKEQGGTDSDDNLQVLCSCCHSKKTARERKNR